MDQATFDPIYRAAQDPRVLALQDLKTPEGFADTAARINAAHLLVAAGLIINAGIDIDGMDPYFYMRELASLAMVWHEALFQGQPASILDYQDASKAWPGSIKVSLELADYPPFAKPAPPAVQSPVGGQTGASGVYVINALAFYHNGVPQYREGSPAVAPDGVAVTAHYGASGIMWGWWWESAAAKARRIAEGG